MNKKQLIDGRTSRPSFFPAAFAELMIVGGASLAAIFIIIPAQTSPSDEIGLAPSFVPTVCAAAVGFLAVAQFIGASIAHGTDNGDGEQRAPIRYALMLMGAACAAVLVTWLIGLLVGCTLLALLVSLILGERRIWMLALVPGCLALTIYIVQWMGF